MNSKHYTTEKTFLLRTPLFPFQPVAAFLEGKEEPDVFFKKLATHPIFKEALFVASPTLHDEMAKWLQGEITDAKEKEKLIASLFKYFSRMSYRCTPYGLFAGISLGELSGSTNLTLDEQKNYSKHTRLDMDFLCSLVLNILRNPDIREQLKYYPNNTSYTVDQQLRYVEYRLDKKTRAHHLVNVDNSSYVQKIIQTAKNGATIQQLSECIVDEEVALEEARQFIHEVVDSQLILSELEPTVTGEEFIYVLIQKLNLIPQAKPIIDCLKKIIHHLEEAKKFNAQDPIAIYQTIIEELKILETEYELGQLFQVDLVKPLSNDQFNRKGVLLNSIVTYEFQKAVTLLAKLRKTGENETLKKFKESFSERYESQEIPLVEVLDAEMGIGYPVGENSQSDFTPLLQNLFFSPREGRNERTYPVSEWYQFLTEKYIEIIQNGELEIELKEKEISKFLKKEEPNMSNSMYGMCSILASSADQLDKGNFLIDYSVAGGPSAGNLLGRFCHACPPLEGIVKNLLREEEKHQPDVLFAEVVHLSQARTGNILLRPTLRNYEIPIISLTSVDDEHTILLEDLMVSVRGGRIIIRSKKLNKEVIPRLTTAHNYSMNALPQYHFLCDLQFQDKKDMPGWDWGMLSDYSFLPRVRYGKTILFSARWIIRWKELGLENKKGKEEEMMVALENYLQAKKIPSWVTLSEGDNKLLLNVDNKLCKEILLHELKKREVIVLEESLFQENNLFIKDKEGFFTNEFLFSFTKKIDDSKLNQTLQNKSQHTFDESIKRKLIPGSNCLYVKIYGGVKTIDRILTDIINPFVKTQIENKSIDRWFFIRYSDPHNHVRLRFFGNELFFGNILKELQELVDPFIENKLIWKIQNDTYDRELERYGFTNIEPSEELFHHDSATILDILSLLSGDEGDMLRWQLAMRGVDYLLNDLGFSLEQKKTFMDGLSQGFAQEFNAISTESKKQLSTKYRENKASIEQIMQEQIDGKSELIPVWKLYEERSERTRDCIKAIQEYAKEKPGILEDLTSSYVHMFLNRFLRSKQRMQEMIIYDFLHQYYRSMMARLKKQ